MFVLVSNTSIYKHEINRFILSYNCNINNLGIILVILIITTNNSQTLKKAVFSNKKFEKADKKVDHGKYTHEVMLS